MVLGGVVRGWQGWWDGLVWEGFAFVFESDTGCLEHVGFEEEGGNFATGLNGGYSFLAYVGDAVAVGVGFCGVGSEGEVGTKTVWCAQTWALAEEYQSEPGADEGSDFVLKFDASERG